MRKPRALQPGDRVAVVAPASPFDHAQFDAGLDELRRLGFEPVFDDRVFARGGFVAGPPALRAQVLSDAWAERSVKGLIGVRGGYGSVEVLSRLDAAEIARTPKVFVGYSDLTSLLIYLTCRCGIVCFHGPMLAGKLGRGPAGYDRESFLAAVARVAPAGELEAVGMETVRRGSARGMLLGGTLTQIVASLGTPYAFAPPGDYILFVDEVGERPYRLRRMFVQLRLSGLLSRATGVVLNELPRCDEPAGTPTAKAAVAEVLDDFPGPVVYGLPSGHTTVPTLTLPFGVAARLEGTGRPRLVIEEAAVC